ncbi:MAG: nucleotidyltransferase domain-containing protein, partial [Candidatus Caldarchaeum sp.]|nr:nucleotidyltransferase domain-containing protein [Candidatus Caldarchaeum sp.]
MDIAEPYATLSKKLTETLKRNLGEKLVSVALFGSVARGEAGPDSDLDILVICEDLPRSRLSRTELFLKSEKELDPLLE